MRRIWFQLLMALVLSPVGLFLVVCFKAYQKKGSQVGSVSRTEQIVVGLIATVGTLFAFAALSKPG